MMLLSPTGTYSLTIEKKIRLFVNVITQNQLKLTGLKASAGIKNTELADRGVKDDY